MILAGDIFAMHLARRVRFQQAAGPTKASCNESKPMTAVCRMSGTIRLRELDDQRRQQYERPPEDHTRGEAAVVRDVVMDDPPAVMGSCAASLRIEWFVSGREGGPGSTTASTCRWPRRAWSAVG